MSERVCPVKKTWPIEIDCPNCAAKLERALAEVPGVTRVSVNYVQKRLTLEAADAAFQAVTDAVLAKAAEIEPDTIIHVGQEKHHHHDACRDDHCGCQHAHEHAHPHEHHHEHDHEHHHHEHDEHCTCGCHDHEHHHHHHHADEVFTSWGTETHKKFTMDFVRDALEELDLGTYGMVLRAKGILPAEDGSWIHFDFVPGEMDLRTGSADTTGKLCVIGSKLDEHGIQHLFGL